jgi:hypothetical protein
MRADLDRPVAGIRNRECDALAALIYLDLAWPNEIFTGDHRNLI